MTIDIDNLLVDLTRSVNGASDEIDRLRDIISQSCACSHDGRGGLATECQEHQEIREQRDELLASLIELRRIVRENSEDCDDFVYARLDRADNIIARVETSLPPS